MPDDNLAGSGWSHRQTIKRLVDGGFAVAEGFSNPNERDQSGNPPVVELADFDAEIFGGFFFRQEPVINRNCRGLRIHTEGSVSKPPRISCHQAALLIGTTFSGAVGMTANHAAAWLLVTTFR